MYSSANTSTATATQSAPTLADTRWFNALWFQTTWFFVVLGREAFLPATLLMIALHLFLVRNTRRELLLMSSVAAIGIGADAILHITGVYQFAGNALVPLWLCGLWLAFATTLTRSLAFLGQRPWLAALAGAVALPLNYWAGQRLGAVTFGYSLPVTLVIVALTWGILLPALYRLSAVIDTAMRREGQA